MEQQRKKVLFLITKSNWGGAQRYVFDLATSLDRGVFNVAVALGGTGKLRDELDAQNIRTVCIRSLTRDVSLIHEVQATRELFSLLRHEKPSVLHINSSKAGILGALVGRLTGVPHIIFTAHGWAFNEDRPLWQRASIAALHWLTVVLAHTTIVVSETTKKQLPGPLVQKKMRVVHNGRTVPHFLERDAARSFLATHAPELARFQGDPWSVTIAELHPVKQHDVTIRALASVVREHPTLRHIIIGEGEERGRLEALIREHGLSEHVFLVGSIHEAAQYLHAFNLFILASRSEALAYVLIEAAAAGLPIIATRVGGIPEIIEQDASGILIEPGDIAALAQSIGTLLTDDARRAELGARAAVRAQHFTLESMVSATTALYGN